jgi:hypothetical protein
MQSCRFLVFVIVALVFSDHGVINCLFRGHEKDGEEMMQSFPLIVGIVCSGLFLVFPSSRAWDRVRGCLIIDRNAKISCIR